MRMQPDALARALLEDMRRSRMQAGDFDVIDAHYFYPDGVAAARVANAMNLPLVISARGSDINLIGDFSFARNRMLQAADRADALIAVSGALAARMKSLGMPSERTHVLRNGVDPDMFWPIAKVEARRQLGLLQSGPWFLGVGNLVREKGLDLLIRAVATISPARLLIVGEGPLLAELRALAHRLAPGRVEFRNNVAQPQLRLMYAACDVLGLPSLREGWPNVLLEAMACGTPVVAAPVGGVPEILQNDAPARLVHEREVGAWRCALRSLWESAMPADRVRAYALRFGWEEVITRQCDLYERIAASNGASSHRRPG
jgi:glycosyltransferase involved in cell wall biosynthesis